MKHVFFFFIILFFSAHIDAQPLKVHKEDHFLLDSAGKPFFWLGDTAWELFHRLDRKEVLIYLNNRYKKGFNVIQAVALYEKQRETPNAFGDFALADSNTNINRPLITEGVNPLEPESYDYWDHVEYVISEAAKRDMIVALLPCWGEYVTPRFHDEPVIKSPGEGYGYGYFIGNRLKHLNDHIVWMLGGDRLPDESPHGVETWKAMAEGITDGISGNKDFNEKADYSKTFMTYHCYQSSAKWFHGDDWIDIHTWGSYHGKYDNERAYLQAKKDFQLDNYKPTLNSEPAYELYPVDYDHKEIKKGRFHAFDVRQIAYWSVFSGTCGHTYGCHPVWQMHIKENPGTINDTSAIKEWLPALDEIGAFQMGYLKKLMLSRPFLTSRPNKLMNL